MTPAATRDTTGTAEVLRLLTDPIRARVVELLAAEQLCTCHLQEELGAKQALVSHHLKLLREAGLVEATSCGRFTYYRLRPGALDGVAAQLAALARASRDEPPRRPC
ncbi:MAG TPA: metalloregulator ArsR/SmtB family transcription factor [Mycobacteriales bacterium]|nr:metalloregulator ArsR/SmtB family transcription factor [Mycobacteriales bacterium]